MAATVLGLGHEGPGAMEGLRHGSGKQESSPVSSKTPVQAAVHIVLEGGKAPGLDHVEDHLAASKSVFQHISEFQATLIPET